uniref:Uncharacterized protein n=1 Tax=Vespula pensylvanica TaxID=30213 RepID=A0A834KJ01_VESPE|nr:hypothetical protein H0235_014392 [Vespula pensylvanica]
MYWSEDYVSKQSRNGRTARLTGSSSIGDRYYGTLVGGISFSPLGPDYVVFSPGLHGSSSTGYLELFGDDKGTSFKI